MPQPPNSPAPPPQLFALHREIDQRVQRIRDDRPDWLCGQGCDSCCRRLAEVPQLSAAEWDLLRQGLAALPAGELQEIAARMAVLATDPARPVVCPLLRQGSGDCPVYAQRPVACRSYGFYVQRALGLYCAAIETQVADCVLAEVVWGNHDAIDQQLAGLGESRSLDAWFASWQDPKVALA